MTANKEDMADKAQALEGEATRHKQALKYHRKSLRLCREEQRKLCEELGRLGIAFEVVKSTA